MKKSFFLFLVLCGLVLTACSSATVTRYITDLPPNDNWQNMTVYRIRTPDRPFVEVGEIVTTNNNINRLKRDAGRMGADAVIIIGPGRVTSTGFSNSFATSPWQNNNVMFGTRVGNSSTQSVGFRAIAIKYQPSRLN